MPGDGYLNGLPLIADVRNTVVPATTGDDQPRPGTSIAQVTCSRFDHESGNVAPGANPLMPGPRNPGHDAGAAGAAEDSETRVASVVRRPKAARRTGEDMAGVWHIIWASRSFRSARTLSGVTVMRRAFLPLLLAFTAIVAVVAQIGAQSWADIGAQNGSQNAQSGGQGGDQFLDGIGETALVARYQFNGTAEDSSRNQLHATVRGADAVFIDDGPRKVLLLTGAGSHVVLPADALAGEDAIAVVGWLYLPTRASGPVFDFGQSPATRLFAVVDAQGFRASAVVGGQVRGETPARPVVENQWTHFAVVLDPASRVLTAYIDGTARARRPTST